MAVKKKAATKATKKPVKRGTSKQSAARRRQIFVEAYITNGGNATEAAKEAGYSAKTARQQGARLLTDVDVEAQIAKRAEQVAKKYELTTDLAARSIVQELTFDPGCLYREDGSLKALHELTEDERMALTGVEFAADKDGNRVLKVKWASRHQAREQLMKHLGMFEKDNEQGRPVVQLVDLTGRKA